MKHFCNFFSSAFKKKSRLHTYITEVHVNIMVVTYIDIVDITENVKINYAGYVIGELCFFLQ